MIRFSLLSTFLFGLITAKESAAANDTIGCFVPGSCESSPIVGINPVHSSDDCLLYCKNTTNCLYFSYYPPPQDICIAFSGCNLSNNSCPECISGDFNCPFHPCFEPGRCLGTLVAITTELDEEACRQTCLDNDDCKFFTFDTNGNTCLQLADCPTVDESCLTCVYGQWNCEPPYQGLSKLLIVGGYNGQEDITDVELIDLLDPDSGCDDPANYPTTIVGHVMAIVADAIWSCGGYRYTNACYNLDTDNNRWIPAVSMNKTRHYAASALLKGGNEWWIVGGRNATDHLDSTEFLRNGEFVPGPDLPHPVRTPCLVAINDSHVFLAGGYNGAEYLSKTYIINLEDGRGWQPLLDMSMGRSTPVCGLINTDEYGVEVVVTGGANAITEIFSLTNLTWRAGPSFPYNVYEASAVPFQDSFIVIGGFYGEEVYDQIFKLNFAENKWDEMRATLSTPVCRFGALMLPDDKVNCIL